MQLSAASKASWSAFVASVVLTAEGLLTQEGQDLGVHGE